MIIKFSNKNVVHVPAKMNGVYSIVIELCEYHSHGYKFSRVNIKALTQ